VLKLYLVVYDTGDGIGNVGTFAAMFASEAKLIACKRWNLIEETRSKMLATPVDLLSDGWSWAV
jgi:hypothetical protein